MTHRLSDGVHPLFLIDHARVQEVLHLREARAFLLDHPFCWDPCPLRDERGNITFCHLLAASVDSYLTRRFVDKVDCLIREEAIGDVALREFRRRTDRVVSDLHPVMFLQLLP